MLLHTFGGLSVEGEEGEGAAPVLGPRQLALLAIIAAANAQGISREKILGILWPDVGEEQGRHTLSQTLYSIRQESGERWISGTKLIKLDASLRSDVTEFLSALKADDLERAASAYTGPFLEGFYLAGAPEFERWVDETRARLQAAALKAVESLARGLESAGQIQQSLEKWRKLTELEPLNSAYAASYLRALVAAGEHATARKFAVEYERRWRDELDLEPEPAIAQIVAQIRAPAAPTPPPLTTSHPHVPKAPLSLSPVAPSSLRTPETSHQNDQRGHSFKTRRVALIGSLIAASLIAVFASQTVAARWRGNGGDALLAIGAIAARDTAEFGPVFRNLLVTNLARVRGIQVLSNTRLQELSAPANDSSHATLAAAARRAGASDVLEGEIGLTSNGLALSLRRVSLASGMVVQGYTLRASDIFSLSDSAIAAIAHDFHVDPPSEAGTTVNTRSAVAYALYENGVNAWSHSDYPAALDLLRAALERDSTFAMAAARAWEAAVFLQHHEEADRLLAIVKRLAPSAVERERLLIESMVAYHLGRPIDEQLNMLEVLTRKFPNDADVQLQRGHLLFSAGDFAGSVAAYDRAIVIDSATAPTGANCRVCNATWMMASVYMWWDSLPAAERAARRITHLPYKGRTELGAVVEVLLRLGRRAQAESTLAKWRVARPGENFEFDGPLNRDLIRWGRLEELEAKLLASLRTAAPKAYGEMPWLLLFTLRNQGRLVEAYALAKDGVLPGTNVRLAEFHDPLSTAVIALEKGDAREAAERFMGMVSAMRSPQPAGVGAGLWARHMSFRMTLAGTALAVAGDTTAVKALADSINVIGKQSSWLRDIRLQHFLRGLVHQRGNRHAEAVGEFRQAVFSLSDGYTRINVEMARSLLALGRADEAIAVLRPAIRGGVDGGNTYATHTELREMMGHAFYEAGQPDSARVYYRAVEQAWRGSDARFAARYKVISDRLASRVIRR